MAYTYIIDKLKLSHNGLQVKDSEGKWVPVHHKQGELDGACGVYSTLMGLLCLGYINYDYIKVDTKTKHMSKKTQKGKMLSKLTEQQGLLRDGYYTSTLAKDLNAFCPDLDIHYHKKESVVLDCILKELMEDRPVVLGVSSPNMGHFILAVGLEYTIDKEDDGDYWTMNKILCLDPSEDLDRSSYWNCVIDIDKRVKGDYPYWYITKGLVTKSKVDDIITIKPIEN